MKTKINYFIITCAFLSSVSIGYQKNNQVFNLKDRNNAYGVTENYYWTEESLGGEEVTEINYDYPKSSEILGSAESNDYIQAIDKENYFGTERTRFIHVAYEYDKLVDAPVYIDDPEAPFIRIGPGQTYSSTVTIEQGTSISYTTGAEEIVSASVSASVEAELEVDALVSSASVSTAISTSIEATGANTYFENYTNTFSKSLSETFTFTNNTNLNEYYRYELRASFKLFVIKVYAMSYKVKEQYVNGIPSYSIVDSKMMLVTNVCKLSLASTNLSRGWYKYKKDSTGNFVFNDVLDDDHTIMY